MKSISVLFAVTLLTLLNAKVVKSVEKPPIIFQVPAGYFRLADVKEDYDPSDYFVLWSHVGQCREARIKEYNPKRHNTKWLLKHVTRWTDDTKSYRCRGKDERIGWGYLAHDKIRTP